MASIYHLAQNGVKFLLLAIHGDNGNESSKREHSVPSCLKNRLASAYLLKQRKKIKKIPAVLNTRKKLLHNIQ